MQKALFRQLQIIELQDEGKPSEHWYLFYLLIPQGTKFHTQKHGCLWFITTDPFSDGWINETFQTQLFHNSEWTSRLGLNYLSRDQTLRSCMSLSYKKH